MKPWQTRAMTGTLPMVLASFMQVAITSALVFSPRTSSNRRITLAGLKKCRPITSSGRLVTAAISSMSRVEVLVAKDRAGFADRLVQPGEDLLLQVHVLEHRLDDDIGVLATVASRVQRTRSGSAMRASTILRIGDPALLGRLFS